MRWLKIAVVVIPFLLIVAVLIVFWRLDSIVRSTVETQASVGLNVPATLRDADVSVFGGKVQLNDFSIGSPKGFSAPQMFSLGEVEVGATYKQLMETPIRVNVIRIEKPTLLIERKDLNFNIKALLDNLPPSDASEASSDKPVRLIIDQLSVVDARVRIRPGIEGMAEEIELAIPTVHVRNVGNSDGAQNGAAVRDVVVVVIAALAEAASDSEKVPEEIRALLKGDFKQLVNAKLANVRGELQKAVDAIKTDPSKIKDVGDELKKGVEEALKGKGK